MSESITTLSIISICGITLFGIFMFVLLLTCGIRYVLRTAYLFKFPQKTQEMVLKKLISNRKVLLAVKKSISNFEELPMLLVPPPTNEMPEETKRGVEGWQEDYAHQSVMAPLTKQLVLQNKGSAHTISKRLMESLELAESSKVNQPIHYTDFVRLAHKLVERVAPKKRLPNQSIRQFFEELQREMEFNPCWERFISLYEEARFGNKEVSKLEYFEFMSNTLTILTYFDQG